MALFHRSFSEGLQYRVALSKVSLMLSEQVAEEQVGLAKAKCILSLGR